MYLIPSPKTFNEKDYCFRINRNTEIILDYNCDFDDLNSAIVLQDEIKEQLGFKLRINKGIVSNKNVIKLNRESGSREAYKVLIEENNIVISGSTGTGVFYGVQTLRQIIRQCGTLLQGVEIEDEPYFENRGFYHDVTRGKVPTLETLMELVDRAAFYKINQIQLYIEHTFAFKGMSEVWVDKDPLTAEEIMLLDQYCQKRHVELVPSLSTFGHLYEALKTKSFNELCELENSQGTQYSFIGRMAHHTLDVTNENSIKLVENMLSQYIPLFSSNKFNICCDETFDLGKGKSKPKADEIGVGLLYTGFLNKVVSFVKGYGKEVMFWGDVILHYPELLGEIPEDVVCLTWDYSCNAIENATKKIAETGRPQYVCPGVAGWSMLMNMMDNGFENIKRMASYGAKHGCVGVLNTDWGDYGHINLLANSIPGMAFGAAMSWNPNGETDFEEVYKGLSIIEYGDESLEIVSLLNKLSKSQLVGWSEAVIWSEIGDSSSNFNDRLANLDTNKIVKGYEVAVEVEEKLTELSYKIKNNKFDLQEFIISARGIQLMDAFFAEVLKNKYKNNESIIEPNKLAESLEEWFCDYADIWRKRNKESELYRIREVVAKVCSYLR